MAAKTCPDDEFIALVQQLGVTKTAKELGLTQRAVAGRRERLERLHDIRIVSGNGDYHNHKERWDAEYPNRIKIELKDGIVLVGSDAHYWPDRISPAHRAYLYLAEKLKPTITCLNGDLLDGPRISRFAPRGWSKSPTVQQELQTVMQRTEELRLAAPKAQRIWLLGNHDYRFENRLAEKAPEYEGVSGTCLRDHFPHWALGMALWLNDDTVVKHRWKGGIHATHSNTLNAGVNFITGHLHSLKVTPFSDYRGTRFGVDTGTLEDPYGPQFEYDEDNPKNHRSGLIVLTFVGGQLLWPEIAAVVDKNHFQFRGQVIKV